MIAQKRIGFTQLFILVKLNILLRLIKVEMNQTVCAKSSTCYTLAKTSNKRGSEDYVAYEGTIINQFDSISYFINSYIS